jgi:hypothetical protein
LLEANMTRSPKKKRKNQRAKKRNLSAASHPDAGAYGIDEFCRRHAISRPTYNRLQEDGRGPAVIKLDQRVLISKEAALAWRQRMEAETKAARQGAE